MHTYYLNLGGAWIRKAAHDNVNCHATTKEMGKKIPERFRIIPYLIR